MSAYTIAGLALARGALSAVVILLAVAWIACGESDVNGEKEADAGSHQPTPAGSDEAWPPSRWKPGDVWGAYRMDNDGWWQLNPDPAPDILTGVPTEPLAFSTTCEPCGQRLLEEADDNAKVSDSHRP